MLANNNSDSILKEVRDSMEAQTKVLQELVDKIQDMSLQNRRSTSPSRDSSTLSIDHNDQRQAKHPEVAAACGPRLKLDPPRFSGSDLQGWIFKVERYFKFYKITKAERMDIVGKLLEGEAGIWFYCQRMNNKLCSWDEFLKALYVRFDPDYNKDYLGELSKLTQHTTVFEYHNSYGRQSWKRNSEVQIQKSATIGTNNTAGTSMNSTPNNRFTNEEKKENSILASSTESEQSENSRSLDDKTAIAPLSYYIENTGELIKQKDAMDMQVDFQFQDSKSSENSDDICYNPEELIKQDDTKDTHVDDDKVHIDVKDQQYKDTMFSAKFPSLHVLVGSRNPHSVPLCLQGHYFPSDSTSCDDKLLEAVAVDTPELQVGQQEPEQFKLDIVAEIEPKLHVFQQGQMENSCVTKLTHEFDNELKNLQEELECVATIEPMFNTRIGQGLGLDKFRDLLESAATYEPKFRTKNDHVHEELTSVAALQLVFQPEFDSEQEVLSSDVKYIIFHDSVSELVHRQELDEQVRKMKLLDIQRLGKAAGIGVEMHKDEEVRT